MEGKRPSYTLTRVEERDLPGRVTTILEQHRGIGNAITGSQIAHALGYQDDRKIRLVIQALIADGLPVAASVKEPFGYYLVQNRAEAEEYAAGLRSRATKTFQRLRDFQRAIERTFGVPYQPLLIQMDEE